MKTRTSLPALALTVSVLCCAPALAGPGDYLVVEAWNSGATGTFVVDIEEAEWDVPGQRLIWELDANQPVAITDDQTGEPIAWMNSCEYVIEFSPRARLDMNFEVQAGTEETSLMFRSPMLSFPTIAAADASGRAWVSLTLEDSTLDPNQDPFTDGFAEMVSTALPPGIGAFRARHNGGVDEGAIFAHMIYQMSVQGEPAHWEDAASVNANQNAPDVGYSPVGVDLNDISVDVSFSLTPQDVLNTRSGFELTLAVPPPTCAGDADANGVLDTADLGYMLSAYASCDGDPEFFAQSDMDADGCINLTDLGMLLVVFGEGC